ncbi:MAG: hypothetical protein O6940_07950, partial [Ignavibacteria bacterium]|nr:hypothetical protein [Ignavibacteria bacterium]
MRWKAMGQSSQFLYTPSNSMNEKRLLDGSLALRDYFEAEDFRGYDLYDTLNSKFSGLLFG